MTFLLSVTCGTIFCQETPGRPLQDEGHVTDKQTNKLISEL